MYLGVVKDVDCINLAPIRYRIFSTTCCVEKSRNNNPDQNLNRNQTLKPIPNQNDNPNPKPNQYQTRKSPKKDTLETLILELFAQEKVISSPGYNKPRSITYPKTGEKNSKSLVENRPQSGMSLGQHLEQSPQMLDQTTFEVNQGFQQIPDSKYTTTDDAHRITTFIANGGDPNTPDAQKAYACSRLQCLSSESTHTVCACNFKTGNVVSFKNECDLRKHNCRYDTGIKYFRNIF